VGFLFGEHKENHPSFTSAVGIVRARHARSRGAKAGNPQRQAEMVMTFLRLNTRG